MDETKKYSTELSALNRIVFLLNSSNSNLLNIEDLNLIRQASLIRTSTSGSISSLCYSFSITNVGDNDAVVLGSTLKSGECIEFPESLNNYFIANSITYDATNTELVITYTY